jgi:3-oxoacyl-[acyl-carrier protein] reductase
MNNSLLGKVALVTGGSRGIGAAIATRLAHEGSDVAFTFLRNTERADDVVEAIKQTGRRALAIRADSADEQAVIGRSTAPPPNSAGSTSWSTTRAPT